MKLKKLIFMVLIMLFICCSYSLGQPSRGTGGASPLGIVDSGASVYPIGEYGASVYPVGEYGASVSRLREFVCNSMSACGMYDMAWANDDAIVNLGAVGSGATVSLGGVERVKP